LVEEYGYCYLLLTLAFADIAEKYLAPDSTPSSLPRTLHFSSEDKTTKYQICQRFGSIMGLSTANIEPDAEGNKAGSAVVRPYDCHLSTRALKELNIAVDTADFEAWWRWEVGAFRK
jgi:dTDP-4-dehydrorhamnose reductase